MDTMLLQAAGTVLGAIGASYVGVKMLCPWLLADLQYFRAIVPPLKKFFGFVQKGYFLVDVFEEQVRKIPDKTFLVWRDEAYTYKVANERVNQIARAALEIGIQRGDTVALMMYNEPAFIFIYLAMLKIDVAISLINTNQRGKALQHSIGVSSTQTLIVGADADLQEAVLAVLAEFPDLTVYTSSIMADCPSSSFSTKLHDVAQTMPTGDVDASIRAGGKDTDTAVYIFTSGTTGLPKAACVSKKRCMVGMVIGEAFGVRETDRLFTCLPLYHGSALLGLLSCAICIGATFVLEKKFSKTRFLETCRSQGVTVIIYIGELCRYLLTNEKSKMDTQHSIRLAIGNGLRSDIWEEFKTRFGIPKICEFYASTEGSAGMVNISGVTGACGRVSPLLRRVMPMNLYEWDMQSESLVRDDKGHCIPVPLGCPGLLLSAINKKQEFVGYKGKKDLTESKIVRNVEKDGDAYYNTGDMMVQDKDYNMYFSDRLGDTFRWKGENVSTTEVSNCLTELHFVVDAAVYGVKIEGHDGRAGMATLLIAEGHQLGDASLEEFHHHCKASLPAYARPLFLRIHPDQLDMTSTLKQNKVRLKDEGFKVKIIKEVVYYLDRKSDCYKILTGDVFDEIANGRITF